MHKLLLWRECIAGERQDPQQPAATSRDSPHDNMRNQTYNNITFVLARRLRVIMEYPHPQSPHGHSYDDPLYDVGASRL